MWWTEHKKKNIIKRKINWKNLQKFFSWNSSWILNFCLLVFVYFFIQPINAHMLVCFYLPFYVCHVRHCFYHSVVNFWPIYTKDMGVRGLFSFIFDHPQFGLLKAYKLHDSFVIIDGDNLIYSIYFGCKVNVICGGDYNK